MRRRAALRFIWERCSFAPLASSATPSVVLLFDEGLDLPGLATIEADLVQTLVANSTDKIEVYRQQMDLSRFGSDIYQICLRDVLRAKSADKKSTWQLRS